MVTELKDINDIFDDILLIEDNITQKGYDEGFQEGVSLGNLEGYQLGYAKGVELGSELGTIYGTVVANLQNTTHSPKILKTLEHLKLSIENFPRENDPNSDILGQIQVIQTQYKKVKAMLRISDQGTSMETKTDLTF